MFSYVARPCFGTDIKIAFRERNEISGKYTYSRYAKFNGKYKIKIWSLPKSTKQKQRDRGENVKEQDQKQFHPKRVGKQNYSMPSLS